MPITTSITDLPTPPSSTDKANFRVRADAFLQSLDNLAQEINNFANEANSLESNVNEKELNISDIQEYLIGLKSYIDTVKDQVVGARNEILSYVIPTEATYNSGEIDEKMASIGNMIWENSIAIEKIKIEGVI